VLLDHALRRFVDVHDSVDSPPTVTLYTILSAPVPDLEIKKILEIAPPPKSIFAHAALDPRTLRLNLQPPELVYVLAADGRTILYGAVYRPDTKVHGFGPYPTLVSVYGGPHVQVGAVQVECS
jgi:dipeptidyl-peptidase-4